MTLISLNNDSKNLSPWKGLQHFDNADMELTIADYKCFNDIRNCLTEHDALELFNVHMLHIHFDIKNDEVLYHLPKKTKIIFDTVPVNSKRVQNGNPAAWRFIPTDDTSKFACVPYIFSSEQHTKSLNENEQKCLAQIGKILIRHQLHNRFSITRQDLSKILKSDNNIYLEENYPEAKRLGVRILPSEKSLSQRKTAATTWSFTGTQNTSIEKATFVTQICANGQCNTDPRPPPRPPPPEPGLFSSV